MATVEFDLLCAFEGHAVDDIRRILDAGFDARSTIKGKSVVTHLIEMYTRSDRFPDCLRMLLDHGATIDDDGLRAVLLDDVDALNEAARRDPTLPSRRHSLACAFSPLEGATLLHVAAEYGHMHVARALIDFGAEVDARAAVDEHGLNGHTPLFHTVNSNANRSAPLMRLLLEAGARPDVSLPGIVWGKGFEWETFCLDVTPISYAQLGLLPQFQRTERDIYDNIRVLMEAAGRRVPAFDNVPNRYLHPRRDP